MVENVFWGETKKKFIEEDLKTFKTWESVLSIPLYSPFQFEQEYGIDIIDILSSMNQDQRDEWKKVLKEPFLGHTQQSYDQSRRFVRVGVDDVETTSWALKSAHHVLSYLISTGKNIKDFDQIVEFGPGIGETCRVINDLGFKGDYYLYDLQEVLRISTFYNKGYSNVKGVTHYSEVPRNKKTLFIGTWSISEAPPSLRDEVFEYFLNADYLIVYQQNAFEYANKPYFTIKFPQIINRNIKVISIPWLDDIEEGSYYLFLD